MKITNVYVERTFNLGNYESCKVGFEANVCEGDIPLEVTAELERMAFQHYENTRNRKDVVPPQKQAPAEWKADKDQIKQLKDTTRTPAAIANENTAKREAAKADPTVCPKCGGKKKENFQQCYNCWEEERGTQGVYGLVILALSNNCTVELMKRPHSTIPHGVNCPRCGATSAKDGHAILGLPLDGETNTMFYKQRYRCSGCGYKWRER